MEELKGNLKQRENKKWKRRYCIVERPSPLSECVDVLFFKSSKSSTTNLKKEDAKQHIRIERFFGVEADSCQFLVEVDRSADSVLQPGTRARLHVNNGRFALVDNIPPNILLSAEFSQLRRYGGLHNRFCFDIGRKAGMSSPEQGRRKFITAISVGDSALDYEQTCTVPSDRRPLLENAPGKYFDSGQPPGFYTNYVFDATSATDDSPLELPSPFMIPTTSSSDPNIPHSHSSSRLQGSSFPPPDAAAAADPGQQHENAPCSSNPLSHSEHAESFFKSPRKSTTVKKLKARHHQKQRDLRMAAAAATSSSGRSSESEAENASLHRHYSAASPGSSSKSSRHSHSKRKPRSSRSQAGNSSGSGVSCNKSLPGSMSAHFSPTHPQLLSPSCHYYAQQQHSTGSYFGAQPCGAAFDATHCRQSSHHDYCNLDVGRACSGTSVCGCIDPGFLAPQYPASVGHCSRDLSAQCVPLAHSHSADVLHQTPRKHSTHQMPGQEHGMYPSPHRDRSAPKDLSHAGYQKHATTVPTYFSSQPISPETAHVLPPRRIVPPPLALSPSQVTPAHCSCCQCRDYMNQAFIDSLKFYYNIDQMVLSLANGHLRGNNNCCGCCCHQHQSPGGAAPGGVGVLLSPTPHPLGNYTPMRPSGGTSPGRQCNYAPMSPYSTQLASRNYQNLEHVRMSSPPAPMAMHCQAVHAATPASPHAHFCIPSPADVLEPESCVESDSDDSEASPSSDEDEDRTTCASMKLETPPPSDPGPSPGRPAFPARSLVHVPATSTGGQRSAPTRMDSLGTRPDGDGTGEDDIQVRVELIRSERRRGSLVDLDLMSFLKPHLGGFPAVRLPEKGSGAPHSATIWREKTAGTAGERIRPASVIGGEFLSGRTDASSPEEQPLPCLRDRRLVSPPPLPIKLTDKIDENRGRKRHSRKLSGRILRRVTSPGNLESPDGAASPSTSDDARSRSISDSSPMHFHRSLTKVSRNFFSSLLHLKKPVAKTVTHVGKPARASICRSESAPGDPSSSSGERTPLSFVRNGTDSQIVELETAAKESALRHSSPSWSLKYNSRSSNSAFVSDSERSHLRRPTSSSAPATPVSVVTSAATSCRHARSSHTASMLTAAYGAHTSIPGSPGADEKGDGSPAVRKESIRARRGLSEAPRLNFSGESVSRGLAKCHLMQRHSDHRKISGSGAGGNVLLSKDHGMRKEDLVAALRQPVRGPYQMYDVAGGSDAEHTTLAPPIFPRSRPAAHVLEQSGGGGGACMITTAADISLENSPLTTPCTDEDRPSVDAATAPESNQRPATLFHRYSSSTSVASCDVKASRYVASDLDAFPPSVVTPGASRHFFPDFPPTIPEQPLNYLDLSLATAKRKELEKGAVAHVMDAVPTCSTSQSPTSPSKFSKSNYVLIDKRKTQAAKALANERVQEAASRSGSLQSLSSLAQSQSLRKAKRWSSRKLKTGVSNRLIRRGSVSSGLEEAASNQFI